MRSGRPSGAVLLAAVLLGCGGPGAPADLQGGGDTAGGDGGAPVRRSAPESPAPAATPEEFAGIEPKSPEEYLAEPWLAEADLSRGELLAYACRACHAFAADEENPLGPNLAGVFGRTAGRADFDYSDALRATGLVWTPEALDAWLAAPASFIPETKMAFTGYRSATDRRDLIAYLLRQTEEVGTPP